MRPIAVSFVLIGAALISACSSSKPAPIELRRLQSPTGTLDAVLVEWPTDATSGFNMGLAIVPRGEEVSGNTSVQVSAAGLIQSSIIWPSTNQISVSYVAGSRIYRFQNYLELFDDGGKPLQIEILLSRKNH